MCKVIRMSLMLLVSLSPIPDLTDTKIFKSTGTNIRTWKDECVVSRFSLITVKWVINA